MGEKTFEKAGIIRKLERAAERKKLITCRTCCNSNRAVASPRNGKKLDKSFTRIEYSFDLIRLYFHIYFFPTEITGAKPHAPNRYSPVFQFLMYAVSKKQLML